MGYPTKVQLINRKKTANQYYINFPTAIAEAMGFSKGEIVYWEIHDRRTMVLQRPDGAGEAHQALGHGLSPNKPGWGLRGNTRKNWLSICWLICSALSAAPLPDCSIRWGDSNRIGARHTDFIGIM